MATAVIIGISIVAGIIILFVIFKNLFFSSRIEKVTSMMDQGSYNLAIKELKNIINKNDMDAYAHFLLAECYFKQENYEWAMPEYRTVLKLNLFNSQLNEHQVRARLAAIFLHYNKLEEAQKEFLLMSKLQPNNYINYYNIGKIFQDRGYLDNGYTYYKKALRINPNHTDSLFKAGEISYLQKRYSDAQMDLQTLLRDDPNYSKAHYYLGMIFLMNKNYPHAIGEFEQSSRDPDYKLQSLAQKGRALFESKEVDKAIVELERALRLIKSEDAISLAIRYYLSLCYEESRHLDKAIEQWEKIAKIRPDYQDVSEKLANYDELRTDDKVKDFLIASDGEFVEMCKNAVQFLNMDVLEINVERGVRVDILATESESKWRNTRRMKRFIRIIRTNDTLGDSVVREVLEAMKEMGCNKSMVITSNKFSRQAIDYAETRPIELIDRDG